MTWTTILPPLAGGILIGLASVFLLLFNGRIAGISGILGGALEHKQRDDTIWRVMFLVGMLTAGLALLMFHPVAFPTTIDTPLVLMAFSGLLVGFGTRLGSGCTSGHGVCGLARFSPRSLVATTTFILMGALSVYITRHLLVAG